MNFKLDETEPVKECEHPAAALVYETARRELDGSISVMCKCQNCLKIIIIKKK